MPSLVDGVCVRVCESVFARVCCCLPIIVAAAVAAAAENRLPFSLRQSLLAARITHRAIGGAEDWLWGLVDVQRGGQQ